MAAWLPGWWRRHPRSCQSLQVVVSALLALTAVSTAHAAFTGQTRNNDNVFQAAASFPNYPTAVGANSPAFYHRGEEAQSAAATSTADDTTANNRDGSYAGRTDGAATWWRMDEGSGLSAADASGAANAGALTGANAGWGPGPSGTAFSVASGTGYVTGAAPVRTDESFTVAAWAYLTSASGDQTIVAQRGTTNLAYALRRDTGGKWEFSVTRGNAATPVDEVQSTANATTGAWVHLTGVYDDAGDRIRLYVNGVAQGTGTAKTLEWNGASTMLVGRASATTEQWIGRVDDVRVHRRAMADADVAALYHTPVTAWDFEENTADFTRDLSNSANHGTLSGTSYWTASGQAGNAAAFSGDDYVTGTRGGVRTDTGFTVAAWVYLTNTTTTRAAVSLPAATTANSSGFVLKYEAGKWQFWLPQTNTSSPTTDKAVSTTNAATSTWVHLAGVYDAAAGQAHLYVNGALEASVAHTTTWAADGVLNAGRSRWGNAWAEPWIGRLDGIALYDHALTEADMAIIVPPVPDPNPDTATLRYDFSEGTGGAGATTADSTGNNNHGTLVGPPAWTTRPDGGNALSFDGNDGVASTATAVRTDQSFSVATWARLTDKSDHYIVLSQNGNTNGHGFALRYDGVNDMWSFYMLTSEAQGTVTQFAVYSAGVTAGTWYHLVGVYDDAANKLRVYVNGATVTNPTDSFADANEWNAGGAFQVGRRQAGGVMGRQLKGQVDGVRTYQRALSAAEVALLRDTGYTTGTPGGGGGGGGGGGTGSAAMRWEFEEGSPSTTIADSTGNGNTGTQNYWGAWSATGRYGKSYENASGGAWPATSDASVIRTDQSFTLAGWVYLTSEAQTRTALAVTGLNSSAVLVQYQSPADRWAFVMRLTDNGTTVTATAGTAAAANTWVHLAAVYDDDANTSRLYVNGVQAGTGAPTTDWTYATNRILVGQGSSGGLDQWHGKVDDVWAFPSALSADDVASVMAGNAPAGGGGSAPAAVEFVAGAANSPMAARQTGALQGAQMGQQGTTAIAFTGNANAYNPTSYTSPNTFTVEAWFRASGTTGGAIIGFATDATGMTTGSADRVVYLDSGGRISFTANPAGGVQSLCTDAAYNDGQWHHVAASMGAGGMKLYVDGVLRKSNAITTGQAITGGRWRWGGVRLTGLPNAPSSSYLIGTLDEVAYYHGAQLLDQDIAWHYRADH